MVLLGYVVDRKFEEIKLLELKDNAPIGSKLFRKTRRDFIVGIN